MVLYPITCGQAEDERNNDRRIVWKFITVGNIIFTVIANRSAIVLLSIGVGYHAHRRNMVPFTVKSFTVIAHHKLLTLSRDKLSLFTVKFLSKRTTTMRMTLSLDRISLVP